MTWRAALAVAVCLATVGGTVWWAQPVPDRIVEIPHATLNYALDEALERDSGVGFLTRVDFDFVTVAWSGDAALTGQGGWIGTTGSGGRNDPDVHRQRWANKLGNLFARPGPFAVPDLDPDDWQIEAHPTHRKSSG